MDETEGFLQKASKITRPKRSWHLLPEEHGGNPSSSWDIWGIWPKTEDTSSFTKNTSWYVIKRIKIFYDHLGFYLTQYGSTFEQLLWWWVVSTIFFKTNFHTNFILSKYMSNSTRSLLFKSSPLLNNFYSIIKLHRPY